jgi:hypothetical protein
VPVSQRRFARKPPVVETTKYVPSGERRADVEHRDLDPRLPGDGAEVADRDELAAVVADVDLLHGERPGGRVGERQVEVGVDGARVRVHPRDARARDALDGCELAGQVQPPVVELHILHSRVGVRAEACDRLAVRQLKTHDAAVRRPVDRVELPPDEHRRTVAAPRERHHRRVDHRHEVRVDVAGVHVEREQVIAREVGRRPGLADGRERPADHDLRPDLDDGVDLSVLDLRRPVGGVGVDDLVLRGVGRVRGRRQRRDQRRGQRRREGERKRAATPGGATHRGSLPPAATCVDVLRVAAPQHTGGPQRRLQSMV